jgi:hypothetical protein
MSPVKAKEFPILRQLFWMAPMAAVQLFWMAPMAAVGDRDVAMTP